MLYITLGEEYCFIIHKHIQSIILISVHKMLAFLFNLITKQITINRILLTKLVRYHFKLVSPGQRNIFYLHTIDKIARTVDDIVQIWQFLLHAKLL